MTFMQTGKTALHCACQKGNLGIVQELIKHGAKKVIFDSVSK